MAERAQRRADGGAIPVQLPARLSVSALVSLARDPAELARQVRRPMPRPPARQARKGTAFHQWLEQRYGQQRLIDDADLFDLADPDDAAGPPGEDLGELRAQFEHSEWADRWPQAVEVPFETLVGDRLVRGRIDAVFADARDGGFDVVDWKTGRPPSSDAERHAVSVQLAAYRLAWAALAEVPVAAVRAAFHYVAFGVTVRPADLLDEAGLTALIDQVPVESPPGPAGPRVMIAGRKGRIRTRTARDHAQAAAPRRSAVLGDEHGQGAGDQRLEDVRQVARVADVVTRPELDRLAGHPDQRPARAERHVLQHAGHVRVGRAGVPRLGVDPVHVPPGPRRARRQQRGLVVGVCRRHRGPLVGPDHLHLRPRRVQQPGERRIQRDADGPQRLQARVPGARLQLGQRRLGDARPPRHLGQRQAGPPPFPPQRGRDELQRRSARHARHARSADANLNPARSGPT